MKITSKKLVKFTNRLFAFMLAALMMSTMLPLSAIAEYGEPVEPPAGACIFGPECPDCAEPTDCECGDCDDCNAPDGADCCDVCECVDCDCIDCECADISSAECVCPDCECPDECECPECECFGSFDGDSQSNDPCFMCGDIGDCECVFGFMPMSAETGPVTVPGSTNFSQSGFMLNANINTPAYPLGIFIGSDATPFPAPMSVFKNGWYHHNTTNAST
ncbi:MAG: hypothetical protein FWD44_04725, partial [Oscillospiraceae bacterium]|nr:hypothetical protein [Oscillospiraceae bacterium]